MATESRKSGSDTVTAVLRATDIMSLFGSREDSYDVSDIAKLTGLNRTTVYRLLNTLIEADWVVRDSDGSYSVSWKVFKIGASAYSKMSVRDVVRPELQSLADEFGDTAFFMIPERRGAVCVDLCIGDSPLQIHGTYVGSTLPLNAGAAPIAMLAVSPEMADDVDFDEFEDYTSATITTPDELHRVLEAVRERGYSISRDDLLQGVSAVAASIIVDDTLIGTISIGGGSERFDDAGLKERGEATRRAAVSVSEALALRSSVGR